jgi:large subunit ribosomal protein L35Ae
MFIKRNSTFLGMEGLITNFRGGRHTKYDNQMIMVVDSVDTKDKAEKLVGKKVTWESPGGKKISGKITKFHGNSGALKVHFEKGMPGQAITNKVKVE